MDGLKLKKTKIKKDICTGESGRLDRNATRRERTCFRKVTALEVVVGRPCTACGGFAVLNPAENSGRF